MYNTKTIFLISELAKLVKNTVLKEIELISAMKIEISSADKQKYTMAIDEIIYLIFTLFTYVENHFRFIEGSAIPNPYLKNVFSLLCPFLYSSSDLVKRIAAVKIKKMINSNLIELSQKSSDAVMNDSEEQEYKVDPYRFKNDIKQLTYTQSQSVDVEMQDEEEELKRAISLSLKENKESHVHESNLAQIHADKVFISETVDFTRQFVKFAKDEILENARNNSITRADLCVYLLTRIIKIYGIHRTSLQYEDYDRDIND